MSINAVILGAYLIIFSGTAFGQVGDQNNKDFIRFASEALDISEFKDSAAIYTCKLQFLIDKTKGGEVLLSTNDSTVTRHIQGLEKLKKFDFVNLMGKNKRVAFQLPLAIIVSPSDSRPGIDSHLLAEKIRLLYYDEKMIPKSFHIIHMFPLITTIDKKTYD